VSDLVELSFRRPSTILACYRDRTEVVPDIAGAVSMLTGMQDPLTLTSPQIQGNGTLAVKNACSDKRRSPNCVSENVSPPLAWSGVPEGTRSFALLPFDPERSCPGRRVAHGGLRHPLRRKGVRRRRTKPARRQICRREEYDGEVGLFRPRHPPGIPTGIITHGRWSPPTST
jgi:hypothetical protein